MLDRLNAWLDELNKNLSSQQEQSKDRLIQSYVDEVYQGHYTGNKDREGLFKEALHYYEEF